jgi:hypothetical protein
MKSGSTHETAETCLPSHVRVGRGVLHTQSISAAGIVGSCFVVICLEKRVWIEAEQLRIGSALAWSLKRTILTFGSWFFVETRVDTRNQGSLGNVALQTEF